jgi:adenylylsulfate kinase
VAEELARQGYAIEILDGDVVRQSLTKGLGFSKEDRDENLHRISFVAELLTRHGVIVLVPVISPYVEIRNEVRRKIDSFIQVYVQAPLEVCESRDVKGLYQKAGAGEIKGFTGIDDPYEAPESSDLVCYTHEESIADSANTVITRIKSHAHGEAAGEGLQEVGLQAVEIVQ